MADIINLLQEFLPHISNIVIWVLFAIFLIIQISDDGDKIIKLFKGLKTKFNLAEKFIWSKIRVRYDKVLYSDDFMKWQSDILHAIYAPLIEKTNEKYQKKGLVDFTKLDIDNHKEEYESITLRLPRRSFPFQGVCPKDKLDVSGPGISSNGDRSIIDNNPKLVKHYYKIIKSTIRYPKRMGYMLEQIHLEDIENWYVEAYCGNFENNLKTSHILEYELYKAYCSNKDIVHKDRQEILEHLPIRKSIHDKFEREEDVLFSGKGRVSLMGVQMLVLVKNNSNSYDALRIRRSAEVSAKPGFLQFIPSGGFEAMNDCTDFDSQWDNYSLKKAIFRELLEECFGQDEDDKKATGNNVSPDRIYHNTHIKNLLQMLESGKAEMQLLGTTMSLVGLRHEFSFIVRIDDSDFAEMLVGNYESKTAVHLVDIKMMEKYEFWNHNANEGRNDLKILNCTSAGLFELARESEIYQKALGD